MEAAGTQRVFAKSSVFNLSDLVMLAKPPTDASRGRGSRESLWQLNDVGDVVRRSRVGVQELCSPRPCPFPRGVHGLGQAIKGFIESRKFHFQKRRIASSTEKGVKATAGRIGP